MLLSHVFPHAPKPNVSDERFTDADVSADGPIATAGRDFALNHANLFRRQCLAHSQFASRVVQVVCACADEQVARINARPVVAGVAAVAGTELGAGRVLKHESRHQSCAPIDADLPVAIPFRKWPLDAVVGLWRSLQELLKPRGGAIVANRLIQIQCAVFCNALIARVTQAAPKSQWRSSAASSTTRWLHA